MDRTQSLESPLGMDSVEPSVALEPEGIQGESTPPSAQDEATLAKLRSAQHEVSAVWTQFAAYRRSTQNDLDGTRAEIASLQTELESKLVELQLAEAMGSELDLAKVEIEQLRAKRTELLDEVNSTRLSLSSARQVLIEAKRQAHDERAATKNSLSIITQKLSDTEVHLAATQTELSYSLNELSAAKSELLASRSELMSTRNKLSVASNTVQAQEALIHQLHASVAQLQTKLDQLGEGEGTPDQRVADLERQLNEARRRFSVAHLEGSKQKARADGLQRQVEELHKSSSRKSQVEADAAKDAKWLISRDINSPAYRERTPPPYVPCLPTLTSPNMLYRV